MNYLVIDTETGGLNHKQHNLLQIYAGVFNEKGKKLEEFNQYIDPCWDKEGNGVVPCLTLRALQINKYFDAFKEEDIETGEQVARDFAKWLVEVSNEYEGLVLLGQNIRFDMNFLTTFMEEHGYHGWDELFDYHMRDPGVVATALKDAGLMKGLRRTSLNSLAYFYKVPANKDKLHDASYDAEITLKVWLKMLEHLKTGEVRELEK